ncbi:hypothetical protein EYF80_019435 [Liparis tanakae]|uniref:Uncharacterized protein n=1 Tax=Liparis tanakae TaxID=230148 RepID=A0A4Z2HX46_9TELE|nr:hypothetical protein EYF80_019435 [Liparis tanakae]
MRGVEATPRQLLIAARQLRVIDLADLGELGSVVRVFNTAIGRSPLSPSHIPPLQLPHLRAQECSRPSRLN